MNNIKTFSICVLLSLLSCSPTTFVRLAEDTLPPWDPSNGFALINQDDDMEIEAKYVGLFALEDGGFTTKCDYYTMLNLAKEQAFAAGANIIKITKVKSPDMRSTCYRLYGRFYFDEDFKRYETKIYRSDDRQLVAADFKDDYLNRPFPVRSVHKIEFFWERTSNNKYWNFKTKPVFECKSSYYNPNTANSGHLEIENLKFAITEKYARLWIKELQSNKITTIKEYNKKIKPIIKDLEDRWDKEKDLFLFEIQNDPNKLKVWKSKIRKDLQNLESYKNKSWLVKM